jgi:hypothetical protein
MYGQVSMHCLYGICAIARGIPMSFSHGYVASKDQWKITSTSNRTASSDGLQVTVFVLASDRFWPPFQERLDAQSQQDSAPTPFQLGFFDKPWARIQWLSFHNTFSKAATDVQR